ncbi:hypothetical protein DPMN_187475 [Dreissena polymorpha]|uniref:Uncharacterized protein n=1 Tax=Dreissena polymorpha TaxID=45954 RepID=A0A9D4DP44_DREPO|nr:hypothetical protein DPMN_187475 [Dreissena polymorpha]
MLSNIRYFAFSASPEDGNMCMAQATFVVIVSTMVAGVVASAVSAVVMWRKLQGKSSILRKLSSGTQMTGVSKS